KWNAYQDLRSALRPSDTTPNSQPLIDYEDGQYIAHVNIGTPPQRFLVVLSLNTAVFWVPDQTCPTSKCPSYCNDAGEWVRT
ncbi:aspartic protease precursor, partial [Aphelenchoides avenae]